VNTLFALYSSSSPFLHHLPPPTGINPLSPHRTCSTLLFSDFVEEKKMKDKRNIAFLLG
jgi:hypothetical protein